MKAVSRDALAISRPAIFGRPMRRAAATFAVAATILATGCDGDNTTAAFDPDLRAVRIETSGCGFASGRTGSGVAVGGAIVVTVAHLIVRADSAVVAMAGGEPGPATVVTLDLGRDLAVLEVEGLNVPEVRMTELSQGSMGKIVGGASSGTVPYEVRRVVDLTIEEILGTDRHERRGYELIASTGDGDSGAGVYDHRRDLAGIVFANGPGQDTTWATASSELEDLLSTIDPDSRYVLCD